MRLCFLRSLRLLFAMAMAVAVSIQLAAQSASSSSSSHHSQTAPKVTHTNSPLDAGGVSNGVYRNKTLGLTCKIPAGWVLRTEEMNAPDEDQAETGDGKLDAKGGTVLLAAFSRPPEARAEDVNSSIVIAAESVATYPGLKDAAQYFGPLAEVAKAQGFTVVEEPYEFAVGTKTLPREDFQKDAGARVIRQSTLAMLAHGWAVSITFIGGTEGEVEDLVQGLSVAGAAKPQGR